MTNKVNDPTLEMLRAKIRELMNQHQDVMIDRKLPDYPAYCEAYGIITGLALAERELLGLDERLNHD